MQERWGFLTSLFSRRRISAAVGLLAAVCTAKASALEEVTLQLKWRHQFQFAGYYAAVEKGFYREAGLEVKLREARQDMDAIQEVLGGRAEYGVATSNLILLRAEGKPVVVLAVIYQHSPFVLLAAKTPEVTNLHDLVGRPIMMEPDAAELKAYFQREGVDPSRLKLAPHSFSVTDLMDGRVAAMSAYSTDEPFNLQQKGFDYLVFTPRAAGIDFYGDNLFTTEAEIERHPRRVSAFLQASLRGWEYAMSHPEEIVDLILRKYDAGKTREQLLFEARETAKLLHPELIELGYVNPGRWRDIKNTYVQLGMLPKSFSLDGFLYERSPRLDLRWLYWVGGATALVAVLSVAWSLLVSHWNRKLAIEVVARKEAESTARAESEAKTQFLSILAHEVRAPLVGVLSALSLGQRSGDPSRKEQLTEVAKASAEKLIEMVDHILLHSKAESNSFVPQGADLAVKDFMEEIVALFRAAALVKNTTLGYAIDPAVPARVRTDAVMLRQILSNLLSNAVKFTEKGRVDLSVKVAEAGANGRAGLISLVVEVEDTGIGIEESRLGEIFRPYTQADSSIGWTYGGTGLGLSISNHLAGLLGGGISVRSRLGEGTVFVLAIRVESLPESLGVSSLPPAAGPAFNGDPA